MSDALT
jgi:hypothetical protein